MEPDFENIEKGSFKTQFQMYQKQHPKSLIKTIEEFADKIVANPSHYQQSTVQRANNYIKAKNKPKSVSFEATEEKTENIRLKYGGSFRIPSIS
jgi:hypothetical protein